MLVFCVHFRYFTSRDLRARKRCETEKNKSKIHFMHCQDGATVSMTVVMTCQRANHHNKKTKIEEDMSQLDDG